MAADPQAGNSERDGPTTPDGDKDAFVVKRAPDGRRIEWSTYLGGEAGAARGRFAGLSGADRAAVVLFLDHLVIEPEAGER